MRVMRASPEAVELTPDFQAPGIMVRNLTMRKSPPPRATRRAKKKGDLRSSSQMARAIAARKGARRVRAIRAVRKSKSRFMGVLAWVAASRKRWEKKANTIWAADEHR